MDHDKEKIYNVVNDWVDRTGSDGILSTWGITDELEKYIDEERDIVMASVLAVVILAHEKGRFITEMTFIEVKDLVKRQLETREIDDE